LSESATHRVMKFKKDHKKQKVVNKIHKVVAVGDSHARGCASEVKQKLNSEYEVVGFSNPGSSMKGIKESVKLKMAQLTKKDIIVPWRGSNDVAKNNTMVGMKHIVDLALHPSNTNVIILSAPYRHDLIKDSCVNREVEVFNWKL